MLRFSSSTLLNTIIKKLIRIAYSPKTMIQRRMMKEEDKAF